MLSSLSYKKASNASFQGFRSPSGGAIYEDPSFSSVTLLLHGDGANAGANSTFIDSSSNNLSLTRVGTVTQGSFSPFSPTAGEAYNIAEHGGSMYFNGSTDTITTPAGTAVLPSTVFTLEFWMWPHATYTNAMSMYGSTSASQLTVCYVAGNASWGIGYTNVAMRITSTTLPTPNQWNHVAVVRSGTGTNQTVLYLNGNAIATGTLTDTYTGTPVYEIGGGTSGAGGKYKGYLSNVRLVNGTAIYTGNFTPPTSPLTAISGTALLLKGENAAIYDNKAGTDILTTADAKTMVAVSKFGGSSIAFDGTGDGLTTTSPYAGATLGTGDFTVEAWVRLNSLVATSTIVSFGSADFRFFADVARLWVLYSGSTIASVTSIFSTNTWYHVAISRVGGTFYTFIDGVLSSTTTAAYTISSTVIYVGHENGGNFLNGYIDDVRVTKGVGRYTANFTPPTEPFPNQ